MIECEYLERLGVYVSKDGKVLKEIKPWVDKDGYNYACFKVNGKKKNYPVHRLVAEVFIPYDESSDGIVMHKDDNPRNNCVENLKWGTFAQNNRDAYISGLKKRAVSVRCRETGEIFATSRDAAIKMFGIPRRGDHIAQVCRGERNIAYGYHWEYVPNEEYKKYFNSSKEVVDL